MAKTQTRYVCDECGRISPRYMGKCPKCGAYNAMQEEVIAAPTKTKSRSPRGLSGTSTPRRIADISGDVEERLPVPIEEFSRVLGGGIVPGSVVLIGWRSRHWQIDLAAAGCH